MMDLSGALIKWLAGGVIILLMAGGAYIGKVKYEGMIIERDAALQASHTYATTISAYQSQFATQAKALNSEKSKEAARQATLLKTLNLIGDIDEKSNQLVPADFLAVTGILYGGAAPGRNPKSQH